MWNAHFTWNIYFQFEEDIGCLCWSRHQQVEGRVDLNNLAQVAMEDKGL